MKFVFAFLLVALVAGAAICWPIRPQKMREVRLPDMEIGSCKFIGCTVLVPEHYTDEQAIKSIFVELPRE